MGGMLQKRMALHQVRQPALAPHLLQGSIQPDRRYRVCRRYKQSSDFLLVHDRQLEGSIYAGKVLCSHAASRQFQCNLQLGVQTSLCVPFCLHLQALADCEYVSLQLWCDCASGSKPQAYKCNWKHQPDKPCHRQRRGRSGSCVDRDHTATGVEEFEQRDWRPGRVAAALRIFMIWLYHLL